VEFSFLSTKFPSWTTTPHWLSCIYSVHLQSRSLVTITWHFLRHQFKEEMEDQEIKSGEQGGCDTTGILCSARYLITE